MTTTSFLPEDYLEQKAERRTNLISLSLFGIVMVSVFAAFLVTNRQWSQVKAARSSINSQFEDAAVQIERLNELERQKDQMLQKARLAAALVERVPRSILLAELINRMPARMGLLKFDLSSEKIKPPRPKSQRGRTSRLRGRGPMRAMTREEANRKKSDPKVEAPRYRVNLKLVGVAPTDVEVSRYIAELNAHPLLQEVTLQYSEERKIEGAQMRQFEIRMRLNPKLDVRDVAPLIRKKSINDPMSEKFKITPKTSRPTASATSGKGS